MKLLRTFLATTFLAFSCLALPSYAKSVSKEKQSTTKSAKKNDKKKSSDKNSKSNKKNKEKNNPKVTLKADDPKAFTKALLYEKEGVEVEFVDLNQLAKQKKKTHKEEDESSDPNDYFDFSTMLIPVTHEALLGSPYGVRDHRLHRGVDVQVIKDEPMVAAYPGKVIMSKYNKGGYGHYVLVEHENGLQTLYGHLSERSVKIGDYVYPGDIVGLAGNTGRSSGAHLHFEIRYGEINIDPATIINFPKWELKEGVEHISKKKIRTAHYNMQKKLKKENVYVVKKGDTLQDVATWFNISEDAVIRINNMKKGQPIRVGQTLKGCK